MGDHKARRSGSKSAVRVPFEAGSNHRTTQAPHIRQYTSTYLDVAPPLIICAGNLKVMTWKAPLPLRFQTVFTSRPASPTLSRPSLAS